MKGLINIKNNDNKCFLWCHIRHLNPLKIHPERIAKADKNVVNNLDYEGIKYPVSKKFFGKIEKKNICINVFCSENNLVYPVHISDKILENCMGLLLVTDKNKSHYVYIKNFNRFMCNKTRRKNKIKINEKNNASYTKKYQAHIPCSFAYKVMCIDDKFSKPVLLYRGKMQSIDLLKQFLKT